MNTDYRQLSSWMGRVNHVPKQQAQRAHCNLVLLLYILLASRKKVLSALRRAKRSFEIIKVKGFFLISPQWSVKIETVIVFR